MSERHIPSKISLHRKLEKYFLIVQDNPRQAVSMWDWMSFKDRIRNMISGQPGNVALEPSIVPGYLRQARMLIPGGIDIRKLGGNGSPHNTIMTHHLRRIL